jgi:hypothetical protein
MDPMSEHTKLFERAAARYEPPDLPMDGLLKRRDRKRRNQRIAAGVIGIAVFVAAVWIVTSLASLDRSQTSVVPAGTGPVQTRPAETGPADAAPPPASDITSAGPLGVGCSAGAGVRLLLTDIGDRIAVRFEVHRSPVGHSWHIVLLHDQADIGGGGFHWDRGAPFFEGTRASGSGDLVVQRSVVDKEWVDGFRAEAVDRQTGQVCRQSARIGPG